MEAYLKSVATANAAAAANAPIIITLSAPDNTGIPVILLLKYPNTKRQSSVATTENFKASLESSIKKYGLNGMMPPTA